MEQEIAPMTYRLKQIPELDNLEIEVKTRDADLHKQGTNRGRFFTKTGDGSLFDGTSLNNILTKGLYLLRTKQKKRSQYLLHHDQSSNCDFQNIYADDINFDQLSLKKLSILTELTVNRSSETKNRPLFVCNVAVTPYETINQAQLKYFFLQTQAKPPPLDS